jgi:hypothetical protein
MNDKFDDLSKSLAANVSDVSRREALHKIGRGIVGLLLAGLGMGHASRAAASTVTCCVYICDELPVGSRRRVCLAPGASCPQRYHSTCYLQSHSSVATCAQCLPLTH